jgi:hypothetical protein
MQCAGFMLLQALKIAVAVILSWVPSSTWAEKRVPVTNPVWKGYGATAIVRPLPQRTVDGKLGRSRYRFFVKGKETYPDVMGKHKTVYFEAKTHAVLRGDRLLLIPRIRIDLEGFLPEYQQKARRKMAKELRALDGLLRTICLKERGSGRTISLRLRPRFTTQRGKNLDWEPNSVQDDWRETTTKSLDFGSKPPFGVIAHEGAHVLWGAAEEYPYLSPQFSKKKTLMAGASALAKDGRTPPALRPAGAPRPLVLAPHSLVPLARVVEGMVGGRWEPVSAKGATARTP